MSEIEYITDHTDLALDRLATQFKGKPKIAGLITAFVEQYQAHEDCINGLLTLRYLDAASGEQLDGLGAIVGAPRGGRTDEDYKNLIIAKIGRNTSRGLPENLIAVFNLLTGSTRSHFLPYFPASCDIYANVDISALNVEDIYDFCQEVLAAGVKLGHIGWFDDEEAFGFAGDPTALGFGDTADPLVGGKFASIVA